MLAATGLVDVVSSQGRAGQVPSPAEARRLNERRAERTPGRIRRLLDSTDQSVELLLGHLVPLPASHLDDLTFLRQFLCGKPVVAVGIVGSPTTQLTERESSIYTSRSFTVSEVLKGPPGSQLLPGDTVTMLYEGGAVIVSGRRVHQRFDSYIPIVEGRTYLFVFTERVPQTRALWTDLLGFGIGGERITPTQWPFDRFGNESPRVVLGKIRGALSTCSTGQAR
jgi:hypothetical protein